VTPVGVEVLLQQVEFLGELLHPLLVAVLGPVAKGLVAG
jgi:hypothetical protein